MTTQPAAVHLRLVLAMLKINTDLERIGDLATNIANETIRLDGKPPLKPLVDIPRMAELCIDMIRDAFWPSSDGTTPGAPKRHSARPRDRRPEHAGVPRALHLHG